MKYRLISLVVVLIAIFGLCSVEAQDRKIIDVQLHAFSLDMIPTDWDSMAGYERPASAEALRRQTIDELERFNITKAITSGPPEELTAYKQAAPDRIIRSLLIPAGLKGDSLRTFLDSLSTWYEQGRFQVIGEVLTQYSGIAPGDSILDPMWSFAEREGVPVGIHINDFNLTCPDSFAQGCTPLVMKDVLDRYPDLKVYIIHAGYPHLKDMIKLMDNYPRVYVDATFNPDLKKQHRYLKGLVEAGYADRIMFGSDQMIYPEFIGDFVHAIKSADFLTQEQKHAIFYDNAARFFDFNF